MSKVKIVSAFFKHPFVKAATTTMDNGKLALKLADDDPPGDQMVDTLEVDSTKKIWTCCSIFTGCCCMPVNILMILFFGAMSFFNPDPADVWTSGSEPGVIYTTDPMNDEFTNIGQLFRVWFMIGFGISIVWTILSIVFILGVCCKSPCAMCTSLFGLVLHVINLGWVIFGFIFMMSVEAYEAFGMSSDSGEGESLTFSTESGSSSDKLEWSGLGYWVLYADMAFLFVLFVLLPVIWCIASCCGKSDD